MIRANVIERKIPCFSRQVHKPRNENIRFNKRKLNLGNVNTQALFVHKSGAKLNQKEWFAFVFIKFAVATYNLLLCLH